MTDAPDLLELSDPWSDEMWGTAVTPANDVPTASESSHMPATPTTAINHLYSQNSRSLDYDACPRIYLSSRVQIAGDNTVDGSVHDPAASTPTATMVDNPKCVAPSLPGLECQNTHH
jgi:hypothetical protein